MLSAYLLRSCRRLLPLGLSLHSWQLTLLLLLCCSINPARSFGPAVASGVRCPCLSCALLPNLHAMMDRPPARTFVGIAGMGVLPLTQDWGWRCMAGMTAVIACTHLAPRQLQG